MAKLKVFRTPIGFHDAYVAAPSQKAALAAWGTDADLFASGLAERVTDARLVDLPLSRPGEVIRVARGSEKEHFRELARSSPPPRRSGTRAKNARPAVHAAPRPVEMASATGGATDRLKPRPSRRALDQAEAALSAEAADYAARLSQLAEREHLLKEERMKLRADHELRAAKLQAKRDKARIDHQRRIELWAAQ